MAAKESLSVTLMIPGLAGFSADRRQEVTSSLPALPALSGILSQSRRLPCNTSGFDSQLGAKFGLSLQQPLPVAALTYWHDKGQPPSQAVLRADPVYLKVDRDSLYLLALRSLHVSRAEADALIAEINELYADTLWSMEFGAADRWYVCSESEIPIETYSLTDVFGKNIDGYLPRGTAGKKWRAIINEIQMLLHNSDVNQQREAHRRLPINSLWLWGEGVLPPRPKNREPALNYVWSNEALCRGLAKWARCVGDDLPGTASEWIKQIAPGRHLVVFDDVRILAKEDFQAWENKLMELDDNWLAPLHEAVKKNQLQLSIEFENTMIFECGKTLWNKWMRKKRSWHEWLR